MTTVRRLRAGMREFAKDVLWNVERYRDSDAAKSDARWAFSYAKELLERLRVRDSLANTVVRNQQERTYRLAVTPRCKYRKVSVTPNLALGLAQHSIGDPCGGKLVVRKLAGQVVDVHCKVCGRVVTTVAAESQDTVKESGHFTRLVQDMGEAAA